MKIKKIKRNTIIWAILWVLSVVLVSFYGGSISYGFFAILTITPIISLLYLIYVYNFFHIYQKVDSNWLVVDDTSQFYFTLMNDYFILFSGIRVKFYSDFSQITGLDEKTEYEFFPKSGMNLNTSITCKCRGEYKVGIETVVIEDYFRLFSFSYKNPEPLKVVVRPKLVKLEEIKNVDVSMSINDVLSPEQEPDVLTRAYVSGDDIRQVHWGLTAKCGELMIRGKIGNQQQRAGLILFTSRYSEQIQEYLPVENKMLETLLALALYLLERKIPMLHYHQAADVIRWDMTGIERFDEYYEMISGIRFDKNYDNNEFLNSIYKDMMLLNSKLIFVIVCQYDEALQQVISQYHDSNMDVMVYFVGREIPLELSSLNLARVKMILIDSEADLQEVM